MRPEQDNAKDQTDTVRDWVRDETARRAREENHERPATLLPLEDFSDEYAEPSRYRTVEQGRVREKAGAIQGLIALDCSGWVDRPTTEEFYEAMRTKEPTRRQQSVTGILLRADFWDMVAAWMEAAFTWRQLARVVSREQHQEASLVHQINRCAKPKS